MCHIQPATQHTKRISGVNGSELQQQMGAVLGRLHELKGSLDLMAGTLEAKLPQPAGLDG